MDDPLQSCFCLLSHNVIVHTLSLKLPCRHSHLHTYFWLKQCVQALLAASATIIACGKLCFQPLFAHAEGFHSYGDVLLAGGNSYRLLVQINSSFSAPATFQDNATFRAPSSFQAPATFSSNATFQSAATFQNSTTFQSPATFQSNATFQGLSAFQNATTFQAPSTFQAPIQLQGDLNMAPNAVLNVSGTAILGAAMTDDLQVYAAATFNSPVNFASSVSFPPGVVFGTMLNATSDTAIGTCSDDTLTVNAAAVFLAALQAEDEVQIGSLLQVSGDTVLGNNSMDQCSLHCAASFTGPVDLVGTSSVPSDASVMSFERQLGGLPVTSGTVLGQILFAGWDGAAQGTGAAIRSVYTVSNPTWQIAIHV